jgi:hypothetical protein
MRVVEQLNMNFLHRYVNLPYQGEKINMCAVDRVMGDILAMQSKYGSFLD